MQRTCCCWCGTSSNPLHELQDPTGGHCQRWLLSCARHVRTGGNRYNDTAGESHRNSKQSFWNRWLWVSGLVVAGWGHANDDANACPDTFQFSGLLQWVSSNAHEKLRERIISVWSSFTCKAGSQSCSRVEPKEAAAYAVGCVWMSLEGHLKPSSPCTTPWSGLVNRQVSTSSHTLPVHDAPPPRVTWGLDAAASWAVTCANLRTGVLDTKTPVRAAQVGAGRFTCNEQQEWHGWSVLLGGYLVWSSWIPGWLPWLSAWTNLQGSWIPGPKK